MDNYFQGFEAIKVQVQNEFLLNTFQILTLYIHNIPFLIHQ